MKIVHSPVLLNECLSYLAPEKKDSLMLDCTLGEGGHSFYFLSKYPSLNIIGIDVNKPILDKAKIRLKQFNNRIKFYNGWSHDYFKLEKKDNQRPDIILIDLGISLFHYEESGLGFSFRNEEVLDMRLDEKSTESAEFVINTYSERELTDLLFKFGEEKFSRQISRAIVDRRNNAKITTAKALADCIYEAVPSFYRHGKIHPATKTFQALRIFVNKEIDKLPELLESAFCELNVGGKLGVIAFHSIEDRIVKNYFKDLGKTCSCLPELPICKCEGLPKAKVLTKKPILASEDEIIANPPSRSARLRVVKKKRGLNE